jgi:predicted nucleic acid-binding protein
VAPTKGDRPIALVDWLDAASSELYVSVITAVEVRDGIAKAKREGATRKAAVLEAWWDAIEHLYGDRLLAFDLRAAAVAGRLSDVARRSGHAPRIADIVIAATAEAHGLIVLTRNRRHFEPLCRSILDPFHTLPPLAGV